MKMLALAILLMSFPWASHAEGWKHSKHRDHYQRGHNNSYFWQDVQQRQHRQDLRIEKGIHKGQLTHREVKKLRREQKHIAKQIRHMSRHHYISRADKRSVFEHLDYVSKKIRILKHNDRYAHKGRYNHRKHKHNYQSYTDNQSYYTNDNMLTKANTNYSTDFYFRF
jgi:hypothetical protein